MGQDNSGEMPKWGSSDTVWMLSLYGTAIGAGVLFLPINAASGGIIPLLVLTILAFPMTYLSHRALCRFILVGKGADITVVVEEQFGKYLGYLITVLYCFALYPILLMYSVSLTNTIESFIQNQLHMIPPSRALIAFILVGFLMMIVQCGKMLIVNIMSTLVYPFIAILMIISVCLIPQWTGEIFKSVSLSGAVHQGGNGLLLTLWLLIPVTVFSFNHFPIISSLAVAKTEEYGDKAEKKCSSIIKYSNILMVVTVLFFVFSCSLCLTPENLHEAKIQNVSILSYLANHFHTPFLSWVAPIVAFVAMCKSFLGHYLGAKEGIHGVVIKSFKFANIDVKQDKFLQIFTTIFIFITAWLVSIYNPNVLTLIESISGPVFAIFLFLMPMYAIHTIPALAKYRGKKSNIFITIIGCIAVSAAIYQFFV
ncbi:aromatic amino acid transport family protein [Commensalibacter papalotli (ex Botero et al. 2024)]|uniref:Amino acid permease (SdaC) n=1 Tax=Commensalibacter papalotli (ex Botero et al. 2024) TaxID=2972766 RepID=A0ABM9HIK2_9PROT|nr:aromatic amino acid transport family protein [Commensalibacter papalotli (ex Botero et al. 2024)]CAI3923205.1 Amino acid permease (SdaC) [Commensalibacter papalotli (ex Botero et al. 2024)]CAI3928943.1 Amino acid permease (SdaC) [Commensalibacter papalotli (ex Botero et al. 2024)]